MSNIRCIEGTRDLLDGEAVLFDRVLDTAEECFGRYGYRRIHTPVFEATDLFCRSLGSETDIVSKEMYTFDAGSRCLTLRPEGTAGVVRALLQHNLHKQGGLNKLWYAGPMFRRERPQKGRQRQFHQVGVEALGAADPLLDAEVVSLGLDFYQALGIADTRTRINSIGCPGAECRGAYKQRLRAALEPRREELCPTCRQRLGRNLLRILDCKNPACRRVVEAMPRSHEHLCGECAEHFRAVRDALGDAGVDFQVDATLVRGLDYYTRTVFEYTHASLGAQDAIGGGGRYDGLVAQLGGPELPAVGFALGVERIMIAMRAMAGDPGPARPLQVFGVARGEQCRRRLAGLLREVRALGLRADMDYEGRSFKAQMRAANRAGALACLVLGEAELERGAVGLKDMGPGGGQSEVPLEQAAARIRRLVQETA